jgi:hypothetical protein
MNWISVNDRLPIEPQEVTIYFANGAGHHATNCWYDDDGFHDICEECGHRDDYHPDSEVYYWMPLPDPPEEAKPEPTTNSKADPYLFAIIELAKRILAKEEESRKEGNQYETTRH